MKSLISHQPINIPNSGFSPSIFFFHFPSLPRENYKFPHIKSPIYPQRSLKLFPIKAAYDSTNSVTFGGWDDSRIGDDSFYLGESTQLRDFFVSIGIDDKKHVFLFVAGVICAFAISKVRISSIIVFPASVMIFAVGFLIGFVRGGRVSEFSANASKRNEKDGNFRVYGEKLMSLLGYFDRLNVKVGNLKSRIETAIDVKEIGLEDLENYVSELELIKLSASDSRKHLETTLEGLRNSSGVVVENQPTSNRKKDDLGAIGTELLQNVGNWFMEKPVNSKTSKAKDKDCIKQRTLEGTRNGRTQGNSSSRAVEDELRNHVHMDEGNSNQVSPQGFADYSILDWDTERRIRVSSKYETFNSSEMGGMVNSYRDREESSHGYKRFWSAKNESETRKSSNSLLDSMDFSVSSRHTEMEASFVQEQMFMKSNRSYGSSRNRKASEDESYRLNFEEERVDEDLNLNSNQHVPDSEFDSRSSVLSDDLLFDRYLSEANNLLKQTKECMRSRNVEERAEVMLYKSVKLLTDAIAMKPMSLLAIGQLGNTYLLHGEIKLKISRELRYLLSRREPLSLENENHVRILRGLASEFKTKDKIASLLVDVCEECEDLLVEAGRKYRLALSIDGNDVRALYNWGLALSFRAQLIADIGPETALEADKVFMAAIDKFEAMMSKGNVYAPNALLRWGMVSHQRSRLRPTNSKQKVKLLQQAKRLYEDALQMDSDNLQIKEALSSCISELNSRM